MRLEDILREFDKAIDKFEYALRQPKNEFVRDSAIKRFEICSELCWKLIKDYLDKEGIRCKTPKSCLKEALPFGIIDSEREWFDILEDSAYTLYVYREDIADDIYNRLPYHLSTMKRLRNIIGNMI